MSVQAVIDAMAIPAAARVDRRVPKSLLIENGAPTAADRRQVNEAVAELTWVAALKPNNVGVREYHDEAREYLEVHVIVVALRGNPRVPRLTELIHRAIPYPVVLWVQHEDLVALSLAHKRRSQAENAAFVVESTFRSPFFDPRTPTPPQAAFLASIALSSLPQLSLFELYEGYLDRLEALLAAEVAGAFRLPAGRPAAAARHDALASRDRIERELADFRRQALREKQMNRRVELNLAIKKLEAELDSLKAPLRGGVE